MRIPENMLVLGKDCYVSRDTHKTQINNNVMVVGGPGSGKTRGVVIPNILQAEGSYVISDPKGNLCDTYGPYLEEKGYEIINVGTDTPGSTVEMGQQRGDLLWDEVAAYLNELLLNRSES